MSEKVTCANADVEMFGANAGSEEREENAGSRAAPDVRVCYTEDPDVV